MEFTRDGMAEKDNIVLLKTKGQILNKNAAKLAGEPIATFLNYPVRDQVWKLKHVCFHRSTGEFALSDERGQVFTMSLVDNIYRTSRLASTAVSALEFIHSRSTQIVVAYKNGVVVIVDTFSRDIVANIQTNSSAAQVLIKCHPTKPFCVMISEKGLATFWDLRALKCVRSLQCAEPIIDVAFEKGGSLIAIVFQTSGIAMYDSKTCQAALTCPVPAQERHPQYTAYCTSKEFGRAILTGDNGMLYVWDLKAGLEVKGSAQNPAECPLVAVAEMPVKVRKAVKLALCGEGKHVYRLLVVSDEGDALIYEVDPAANRQVGSYRIISLLAREVAQGVSLPLRSTIQGQIIEPPSDQIDLSGFPPVQKKALTNSVACYGTENGHIFAIVGVDGGMRLFDADTCVGVGGADGGVGRFLRARYPHGTGAFAMVDEPDEFTADEPMTTLRDTPLNSQNPPGVSGLAGAAAESGEGFNSAGSGNKQPKKKAGSVGRGTATSAGRKDRATSKDEPPKRSSGAFGVSAQRVKEMPLFELAALSPSERRVNAAKLEAFVKENGEFPARYRPLIWRFLLRLPENTDAFADLVRRGTHPSMQNLHNQYPIRSRRVFERLHGVCNQMTHWSEIFSQTPFLPHLAFPFTLVYGQDELAILETVMTIFMWWGYSWHATFPHPPAHILDSFDCILRKVDAKLHSHLTVVGVVPGVLCWGMFSTLFTEFLSREDWLRLMDYLFANFQKAEVALLAPIALMRVTRASVLSAGHEDHIIRYYRSRQGVRVSDVVKMIENMLCSVPQKLFSSVLVGDPPIAGGPGAEAVSQGDVAEARESIATTKGKPVFPLPRGRYPAYDGFPAHLVDWQLRDRERAMALDTEIKSRQEILEQLSERITKSQADHHVWMAQHESAAATELTHRQKVMEKEKERLRQLQDIEEKITRQRIDALNVADKAAKEELDLMDRIARDAKKVSELGEKHMAEKVDITLQLQRHKELAEEQERVTSEKVRTMYASRSKEEWMSNLSQTLRSKELELEREDALLAESWRREDEVARVKRQSRVEQAREDVQVEGFERIQSEMLQRLQRLQMERETKVLEMERLRAKRLAQEAADEGVGAAERSEMLLRKQQADASAETLANLAEKGVHSIQDKLLETVDLIKTEGLRLVEAERVHILRQNKARMDATNAEIRREWARKQESQLKAVLEAETAVQEQVLRLQRAAIRAEVEEETLAESGGGRGFGEMQARIESLGEDILRDQRERFQEMREEAANFERQALQGTAKATTKGTSKPVTENDGDSDDMDLTRAVERSRERAKKRASTSASDTRSSKSNAPAPSATGAAADKVALESMARDTLAALRRARADGAIGSSGAGMNSSSGGSGMSEDEMMDYIAGK